jgi:hypothetical protein
MRARLHEERGLVGRASIVILALVVVLGVGTIDAISIVLTTLRTSKAAETAAVTGAATLNRTNDPARAAQDAFREVQKEFPEAELCGPRAKRLRGCDVLVRSTRATGEVSVVVRQTASTFVVHRVGLLEEFSVVREEAVATPPTI